MLSFFVPMQPPTTTFQGKQVNWQRRVIYDSDKVVQARQKITAHLAKHAPKDPMKGAVRLMVVWTYQSTEKYLQGAKKTTKPDLDNVQKLLLDAMTKLRFWKDDAQVALMAVSKYYGDVPGIYIEVEEVE